MNLSWFHTENFLHTSTQTGAGFFKVCTQRICPPVFLPSHFVVSRGLTWSFLNLCGFDLSGRSESKQVYLLVDMKVSIFKPSHHIQHHFPFYASFAHHSWLLEAFLPFLKWISISLWREKVHGIAQSCQILKAMLSRVGTWWEPTKKTLQRKALANHLCFYLPTIPLQRLPYVSCNLQPDGSYIHCRYITVILKLYTYYHFLSWQKDFWGHRTRRWRASGNKEELWITYCGCFISTAKPSALSVAMNPQWKIIPMWELPQFIFQG